jgi:hypothetical protein
VTDYEEPTNEQLANFLSIYAEHLPAFQHIRIGNQSLSPAILEMLLERRPEFREIGLRHHKKFQEDIIKHAQAMNAGTLKCEHIRPNGMRCVNYNEPGSIYCGLHKDED